MPRIRRRWLRFSVRTFFVVMTLFCLWIGPKINHARTQRVAVDRLRKVSVSVEYDCHPDDLWAPRWVRSLVGDDFFLEAVRAHAQPDNGSRQSFTPMELDEMVVAIRQLPGVHWLELCHAGIQDDDLARLTPLRNQLERIDLHQYKSSLTGRGIKCFRNWPRLKALGIYVERFDVSTLIHAPEMTQLESLELWDCHLDEGAFATLGRCAQLRYLGLRECRFDGQSLARLQTAKHLTTIRFTNMQAVVHSGFRGPQVLENNPISAASYEFSPYQEFSSEQSVNQDLFHKKSRRWFEDILPGVSFSNSYVST